MYRENRFTVTHAHAAAQGRLTLYWVFLVQGHA
jgi:hypothetical protein